MAGFFDGIANYFSFTKDNKKVSYVDHRQIFFTVEDNTDVYSDAIYPEFDEEVKEDYITTEALRRFDAWKAQKEVK